MVKLDTSAAATLYSGLCLQRTEHLEDSKLGSLQKPLYISVT